MKNAITFLDQLLRNNNRDWFNAHKSEYLEIQSRFNEFVSQLIIGVSSFDETIKGVTVKDCTYRIYRDLRFSPDKTPYKTHLGAYICRGGKCSGFAGYYFHIEPDEAAYIGSNILAAGLHAPTPAQIKLVRESILHDGDQFQQVLTEASGFTHDKQYSLRRVPNGYPSDSPFAPFFKLKDYSISTPLSKDILFGTNLLEYVLTEFQKTKNYNLFLNRIIEKS